MRNNMLDEIIEKWKKEAKEWQTERLNTTDFQLKNIYSQHEIDIEEFLKDLEQLKTGYSWVWP